MQERTRILFLAANPDATTPLHAGREVRRIREQLAAATNGSLFDLIERWAVRPGDLQPALIEIRPHIVHFSGHGNDNSELMLEGEGGSPQPVSQRVLGELFRLRGEGVRLVVLSACHSLPQAETIAEHVECAIGMRRAIGSEAATELSAALYRAIASGDSIQRAFESARLHLEVSGIPEHRTPQLTVRRDGVDPGRIVLVGPVQRVDNAGVLSPASEKPAPPSIGKLANVPELPPNFLPREGDLTRLKELVLSGSGGAVGPTGRTIRAGVHGMGGVGKSVLAAQLARDEQVRRAFRDGVYWIALGREPKLTLLQSELCALFGQRGAVFEDPRAGQARLTELYQDRSCLVILDDVWDARHASAFGELGPNSRMLLTTRDVGLVYSLGGACCSLDVLAPEEALALLAGWSGQPASGLPSEARAVAEECGYLPLALSMIGAMVRGRPERWKNALHKLRTADLEAIRRSFPEYPYPDLLRAIEVSLEAIDPSERLYYLDFAVFAEGTAVPEAAIATLWGTRGLDTYAAQDLVDSFVDRSLVRRDEAGRLRLHDLQYHYVRRRAGDLSILHGRLVDAYRAACPGGWAQGPKDGYFFLYLATHLDRAGKTAELRGLLVDYAWLAAKLAVTDPAALLADYGLAPADEAARLVEGAIRLSAHVLAMDKGQLPSQLVGRLLGEESAEIRALVDAASRSQAGPWLCPLTADLTRPGGPLRCTLSGHSDEVAAVAVTPDSRRAVSGSVDGTLRLWDLATGREIRALTGHSSGVTAVAVTPVGDYAISGSDDGTLKVWELATGRELRVLTGHSKRITALAVTPNGRFLVSGSGDRMLKVWDLAAGREIRALPGHSRRVTAVALTPDGRFILSGAASGSLKIWDLESGQELRTLGMHRGEVMALAVTPDGKYAISSAWREPPTLWDLATGRAVRTTTGRTGVVTSVAVTPDGRYAILGSMIHDLLLWDFSAGGEVRALAGHLSSIMAVAVTPDGRYAVSGSSDKTLKVWALYAHHEARAASGHSSKVTALAMAPDGRYAVSGSDDMRLKVWDLSALREARSLSWRSEKLTPTGCAAVAITPDGRCAVSSSGDKTLKVWEVSTGREIHTLVGHSTGITTVVVTPDGCNAISVSLNTVVKVWDLATGSEVRSLRLPWGWATMVALTPDGQHSIAGPYTNTLTIHNLETGREVGTLAGHAASILAVAVTLDGRRAVSASYDKTLKVWDLAACRELRTLAGHSGAVTAVAVFADGRRAASGSDDQTLRVWDIMTGACLATFYGDSSFHSLAVTPDGRTILAGDAGGRVHFFGMKGVTRE